MRFAIVGLAASLALLTACQDKAEPAAPASATASASAPAVKNLPPAGDMGKPGEPGLRPGMAPRIVTDTSPVDTQVLEVKLSDRGNNKMLTGVITDQFKPSDGVFMSIRTEGTAGKYTLSSKWLTPSGETLTEYSQIISTPGPTDTIFSLSKPDGWAKGQYHVELSINGKQLRSVPFTVH